LGLRARYFDSTLPRLPDIRHRLAGRFSREIVAMRMRQHSWRCGGRLLLLLVGALAGLASPARADDIRRAIAHPFTLVDTDGKRVTSGDFPGKIQLIYFGYTHCADQCPTSVSTMLEALDEMGPAARYVVPFFISVDPERDTAAVLKDYTASFDPKLVGLTGTPDEIRQAADAVGVQYAKIQLTATDYSIDHSWTMSVIDRTGKNARTFDFSAPHMLAKTLFDMLAAAGVDLEDVPNIGAYR
jgi:cytochrome oxidase Cu insertion factor (SCO1/SenC/PrrC family)